MSEVLDYLASHIFGGRPMAGVSLLKRVTSSKRIEPKVNEGKGDYGDAGICSRADANVGKRDTRTFRLLLFANRHAADRVVWALALGTWCSGKSPIFSALEDALECWLLNARHMHKVPGRKTEMADAEPQPGPKRQAARKDKEVRFTALLHHVTPARVRGLPGRGGSAGRCQASCGSSCE